MGNEASTLSEQSKKPTDEIKTLHFCILVHGWTGLRADFTYFEKTLHETSASYIEENPSVVSTTDFIIHNCKCNENNTNDGIEPGGERVAYETMDLIQTTLSKYSAENQKNIQNIVLSFVGASLGGMYVRHAVGILWEKLSDKSNASTLLWGRGDDQKQVFFNTFYALVVPHIGLVRNSFILLPRIVQAGLCRVLGTTLDDVFCFTDTIWKLSTSSRFLDPLASFHKLVSYVNAYHTDFSVPTETAGFLHKESAHEHEFVDIDSNDNELKYMVATVATKKTHKVNQESSESDKNKSLGEDGQVNYYDDAVMIEMCENLDKLGWKKVFVDTRNVIKIGVSLNFLFANANESHKTILDELREKRIVESKDLSEALSSPFSSPDLQIVFPMGHKTICACSRNPKDVYMFNGGQVIVNKMLKDLVSDIFSWKVVDHN